MPKEKLWNALYWCGLALAVTFIIFFATAPILHPKQIEISFAPEAHVPVRSGSRGDGDYDRWRRSVIDHR